MEKQFIGIDLHKAFFQACAVDEAGARLWEERLPRSESGIAALRARCTATTALAVEASTPVWHFADAVTDAVGYLHVVDPFKTKLKAGFAAKTDRLDARRLADALRRDSVVGIYVPSREVREWRELCRGRHGLVQTRTAVINQLRALLLRHGLVDRRALAQSADDTWLEAVELPPQARASVRALRQVLGVLRTEVRQAERIIRALAAQDPIARHLQALRGIGPILAMMLRAEIGDVGRFKTGAQLASYAGLVPRVEASAGRVRYGRITRRGSPWLRWALVEAAIHGPKRSDRVGKWGRRLALRKGALKARVTLARVLAEEIHRHWHAAV
jgi:transposase